MKHKFLGQKLLKTVLTVLMCLSFTLGLTQLGHTAPKLDESTFAVTDHMSISEPAGTESEIVTPADFKSDCCDHLIMDQSNCADICCDSNCKSFIMVSTFESAKPDFKKTSGLLSDGLTNRSVAPLPFPPRK